MAVLCQSQTDRVCSFCHELVPDPKWIDWSMFDLPEESLEGLRSPFFLKPLLPAGCYTLPKTNMDPGNGSLEDDFPLLTSGFQGPC